MANFIYGKVKRKSGIFRIIQTEEDIYDISQLLLNGVEYNPVTLIEEEEFYQLTSFSNSGYSLEFMQDDIDSVNIDQITKADLKKLSFICTVQANLYFFQVINSNFYVSKKWFSIDELTLEIDKPIITINACADAIYDKQTDTLYFKKLTAAQKLFKGMDQLYREATELETQAFLENDFLVVNEDFVAQHVTVPNRKRIALVNATLNRFSTEEKEVIYNYTHQYGQVGFEHGKFKIETDNDLKFVLWGIEQRFYTTPIGGEKRIANSIISL